MHNPLKKKSPPRRELRTAPDERDDATFYRRNRTLSGYGMQSRRLELTDAGKERAHVHHLRHKRRKAGLILLSSLSAIVILSIILTQFTAQIEVGTSDTTVSSSLKADRYQRVISDYLAGRPIERLRFALNEAALGQYMSSRLPEVNAIRQENLPGIGSTHFVVSLRRPIAGWRINNNQYYVDAKGVAFEENYYRAPDVQIVDNSGANVNAGGAVASTRLLGFVGKVVSYSQSKGLKVQEATLPLGTTRQLELRIENVKPVIRLSIDRPAGEQVEDYARAISYIEQHNLAPSYMDVRVSGKAFYR
ncbi:MAG: hypothetical protein JWN33_583 [Candidatus Saccharibacteria bacterium]|nr:hypothetical protein [Candidatus Saccharibacteria bacterium]